MRNLLSSAIFFCVAFHIFVAGCSSSGDDLPGLDQRGDYEREIPFGGDDESLFEEGDGDDSADGDGNDNGDSDEEQTPQMQVERVAAEITDGRMSQDVEMLEKMVFPHLSADYMRAGLDRAGQMEYERRLVFENADLQLTTFRASYKVEIEEDEAVVDIASEITAILTKPQGRVFIQNLSIKYEDRAWFVLENNTDWRCITEQRVFADIRASGGGTIAETDLSDFSLSGHEISAGGSISLSGSFDVPQLGEGELLRVALALDFGDKRSNALEWTEAAETIWSADISDKSGSRFEFDVKLPDEGLPGKISVPQNLEIGQDVINASLVLSRFNGSDFTLRHLDRRSFSIPLKNAGHAPFCPAVKDDSADGLWKIQLSNSSAPELNLYQLADLRLVDGEVYGHVLYISRTTENAYVPTALEVAGNVEDDLIRFSFDGDDFSVEYTGKIEDGVINGGQAVFQVSLTSIITDFNAEKLDQRCVGLLPGDMNDSRLKLKIGDANLRYVISSENHNVLLASSNAEQNLKGYLIRNILAAVNENSPGSWLLLGFYDGTCGFAVSAADSSIVEGSFSVETNLP